jgi:glycosyltransferase involved in cell wall biosynthesis
MPERAATPAIGMSLLSVRPDQIGGAGTYIQELLAEFGRRQTVKVQVLANTAVMSEYHELERGGVSLRHVTSFALGQSRFSRVRAMAGAMMAPGRITRRGSGPIDIMHYPAAIALPRTKKPTILTLHDIQHHDLPQFFSRAMRTYRAIFYDREARRATIVITVSEHARSRLIDVLGLNPDHVVAIHHGIDHVSFRPEPNNDDVLLAPFDLPERFIIYPAALLPHKNHKALLEAFAKISIEDTSLVLCGPTLGHKEKILNLAISMGLGERVMHLGFVKRDVIPPLYRRAVALIFPSLYEGFGAPPLEAMACGCPVGSSNAGSLPEVCSGAALMFDPSSVDSIASAIEQVVTGDHARATLSRQGFARAGQFTWTRAADMHLHTYERAFNESD